MEAAHLSGGAQPLSLRHGVRCESRPDVAVEDVLLAVGEFVGYGSRASSEAHEGEGGSETAPSAQVEAVSTGDAATGESVVSVDMPVTQEEEEGFSDFSDIASQAGEDQPLYSVQEINAFLDETFGKVVEMTDFFPDVERFVASVAKIRKPTVIGTMRWSGVCGGMESMHSVMGPISVQGVAVFFSRRLGIGHLHVSELEQGRLLLVQVDIRGTGFLFVNVYAPNHGGERVRLFRKLRAALQRYSDTLSVVMGGDWNCTTDFTLDRNGEEPHSGSAAELGGLLKECGFVDPWREFNTGVRQYTWVKVSERRVSAARLDRFYITKADRHRVLNAFMAPSGFSDHHAVILDVLLTRTTNPRSYWRFNVKLIQDEMFCRNFTVFWEGWRMRKADFDNVALWWEVGKTQIKSFCQLYSAHVASVVKGTVWGLEREISLIEDELG
ncbi:hypothetical protein MHYP_G00061630 [Metynnis hypsauchen]